jgi:hypothetical protein
LIPPILRCGRFGIAPDASKDCSLQVLDRIIAIAARQPQAQMNISGSQDFYPQAPLKPYR